VANVIWCTGFRPDFSWIDLPVIRDDKIEPIHRRGIVSNQPGLYFVGLFFQYAASSGLVGGVGRDAAHVVDAIASRTRGDRSAHHQDPTATDVEATKNATSRERGRELS
jgi:putative flavoprotein involved in K+ transport